MRFLRGGLSRCIHGLGVLCLLFSLALPVRAQLRQSIDTTMFVVMGEGLAAGMANFGLSSVVQNQSFPARIARQMGTAFPSLFEARPWSRRLAGIFAAAGAGTDVSGRYAAPFPLIKRGPSVYCRGLFEMPNGNPAGLAGSGKSKHHIRR